MNIFNKVALQGLKKSRTRTFVTIIGVILSAAMFTAVTTFGVSLIQYMTDGAVMKYGGWQTAFLNVDSAFAEKQQDNSLVESTAAYENIGYTPIANAKNPDRPYLLLAGFDQDTFDTLPITLISGRLPENSNELLMTGKADANSSGAYKVGSTVTFPVGNRMDEDKKLNQNHPYQSERETFVPEEERTYTVVGICQTPAFEEDSWPGYTVITIADAEPGAKDMNLFVTLKNPRKVYSYIDAAAEGHASIMNDEVLRFMGLSRNPSDKIFNALLFSVGGIVVAIIMIGSIFLIYNSFSISLSERTQQIGMLASIGATAKQLRNSVLFEGFCIGIIGIPIGILAGLGSIHLVISVVARNFGTLLYENVPLTLKISALALVGAAAVSLVTILISAYLPAKRAVNLPVMECIRQTNEVKVEAKSMKISKLSWRLYGLEGTLALKNFKRNKKRYRSIVLSLVLSIVLFVSTSAFVTYLKQESSRMTELTTYDVGFGTQNMDDGEMLKLFHSLKGAKGVSDASYQAVMEYTCEVQTDWLSDRYREEQGLENSGQMVNLPLIIQFMEDKAYEELVNSLGLPVGEYTGANGKAIAVAKMDDSKAENVYALPDLFTSPALNLSVWPRTSNAPKENIALTFVEISPPDTPPMNGTTEKQAYTFQVMAPWSMKEKLLPAEDSADTLVKGLTFQSETPTQTMGEMKTIIQNAGLTSAYILLNSAQMLEESRNYIFIANVFAYTFIIMISLIAVANVFNTISTNIKLRRQELAMLRSVGMSDKDFNKMMRFECAFYGMRALLYGLPLAGVISWLIYKGMFEGGADEIKFVLPWTSIGISVCSVLLVIFVTMMYATSKIRKENIIDALRDDIT